MNKALQKYYFACEIIKKSALLFQLAVSRIHTTCRGRRSRTQAACCATGVRKDEDWKRPAMYRWKVRPILLVLGCGTSPRMHALASRLGILLAQPQRSRWTNPIVILMVLDQLTYAIMKSQAYILFFFFNLLNNDILIMVWWRKDIYSTLWFCSLTHYHILQNGINIHHQPLTNKQVKFTSSSSPY